MAVPLILVTAGGLARETAEAARAAGYEITGYLDDDPASWGTTRAGVKVLGGVDAIVEHTDAMVTVCAGKGTVRQALVGRLARSGVAEERYATVVHPSVVLPASSHVAAGSVLLAGCALTADVDLARHVVCMPNVTLTHDDVIADFATLCAGLTLGGGVQVGSRAYLGMAASVRENVTIGADAVIGMGAVVVCDVPAGQTWAGVPARQLPSSGCDPR